jgi:hypothetical protein
MEETTPTTQPDVSPQPEVTQQEMYNCFLARKTINGQDVILQHFTKYVNVWEVNPVINQIKTDIFGANVRNYQWVKDLGAFNNMPVVKVTLLGSSVVQTEEVKMLSISDYPKTEFLMSLGKDSAGLQSVFIHAIALNDVKVIKTNLRVRKHIEKLIADKYGKLYPIILIKENTNFSQFNHFHVMIDMRHAKNSIQATLINVREPADKKWVKFSDVGEINSVIQDTVSDETIAELYAMVTTDQTDNQSVLAEGSETLVNEMENPTE